jgi:hypothetical protein
MAAYLPPGWPTGVHPPGSEEFERTAVAWLLDVVPPDYRLHGVLQRHPIALATLARRHLTACVEGARQGYRTARTELGDVLPVSGLDAVLAAYRSEGRRLVNIARAADLVERALRGKEFTPRLDDPPGPARQPGPAGPPRPADRPGPAKQSTQPTQPPERNGHRRPTPGQQATGQPAAGQQPAEQDAAGQRAAAQPAAGKQAEEQAAVGKQATEQPTARKQRQKQTAGGKQRRG